MAVVVVLPMPYLLKDKNKTQDHDLSDIFIILLGNEVHKGLKVTRKLLDTDDRVLEESTPLHICTC